MISFTFSRDKQSYEVQNAQNMKQIPVQLDNLYGESWNSYSTGGLVVKY